MSRMVKCKKLGRELPGLPFKPFDDELGQRIYDEVSVDAWRMWLADSVKYVNTYRLDLADRTAQEFMRKQMAVYFGFEEGNLAQTAWSPPKPGEPGEPKPG
jgi:Fe-S cluster biosynthesis and repair protein YggX